MGGGAVLIRLSCGHVHMSKNLFREAESHATLMAARAEAQELLTRTRTEVSKEAILIQSVPKQDKNKSSTPLAKLVLIQWYILKIKKDPLLSHLPYLG